MHDRPVWAEINLDAFNNNITRVKSLLSGGTKICAIVKADAYGHGAAPAAYEALAAGASCLGVAIISEGVELRKAGITAPILVMTITPPELANLAAEYDLQTAVSDILSINALARAAKAKVRTVGVHLKIDTGMGRIGVRPEDAPAFAGLIRESEGLNLAGVFSHFADSDNSDQSYARRQLSVFLSACSAIEKNGITIPVKHIANSGAILNLRDSHLDMVRPGILLYGFDSQRIDRPRDETEYIPVMALKAKAAFVKKIGQGQSVSYGRRWISDKPGIIASVPLGYADGYSRSFTNKGFVGVRGQNVPVRGTVCMDQFMIDVSQFEDFETGEEVVVFGKNGPHADDLAAAIGTINYEIVTRIGKRVPRVYIRNR